MPTFTYPGVYIEELPSSVHTITGVATSIAAFVGWADQGPTDRAVMVESFMDFQRQYGGLDSRSLLGYAVSHFFNNGGQQAYVIRLVQNSAITSGTGPSAASGTVTIPAPGGSLTFTTKTPGAWSNAYAIRISATDTTANTFTVQVVYAPMGQALVILEDFAGLSISSPSINSKYVTLAPPTGTLTAPPGEGLYLLGVGSDGDGVSVPAAAAAQATVNDPINSAAGFAFTAQNPGSWGNLLAIGATPLASDSTKTRFSVNVVALTPDGRLNVVETFNNLSVNASDPSYVVTVLNADSNYVSVAAVGTPTQALNSPFPPSSAASLPFTAPPFMSGGYDGVVLDPDPTKDTAALFITALNADGTGTGGARLLDRVDIFNLLCVPGETDDTTIGYLQKYCSDKRAFYIVDCPENVSLTNLSSNGPTGSGSGGFTSQYSINSAYYYPWITAPDPLIGNRTRPFPPCGFVAGIYASTDANRHVWKAPAGIGASLTGVSGLEYNLTDLENGDLNTKAINCLRQFKVYGNVVWGARTLQGNDQVGSQWKYVPIRRLALYLESSLYDGLQWVVFEPNDEPLWSQIRLNVGVFMQGLFLQGAFQGTTPRQAYFVKCDAENNPQASIDQGIVNILVGFAPLYPAEFVVIEIEQMAGQLQV